MNTQLNRRDFLAWTTAATGLLSLSDGLGTSLAAATPSSGVPRLHKALIRGKPTEAMLRGLKAAGFDGVEGGIQSPAAAEKCRAIAEKLGMRIHSVMRGWAEFNSPDPTRVEQTFKVTQDALRAAQGYGADTILLVPCRIGGMRMPRPWEFVIEFDDRTGHLTRVVTGDNRPYADYIRAHNHAIDTSRIAVQRLIPLAEQCGVVIALENVWNNLWVKPDFFRHWVASFQSPWVKAYFDIGNHVKYEAPEQWILRLGPLLAKCHVKDFKLAMHDPNGGGKFVDIREGNVRWPVVRAALEDVGYHGWLTIEGGDLTVTEDSRRLDQIIAGT